MPLHTDPDTLRIPAFMRKRNIRSRSKKALLLTALDRKNAGVLPEGMRKKKKNVRKRHAFPVISTESRLGGTSGEISRFQSDSTHGRLRVVNRPSLDFSTPPRQRRGSARNDKKKRSSSPRNLFAPPLLDFSEPEIAKIPYHKQKIVGVITHYYNKIHVAVIKLSTTLAIGDSITYDTDDGPYKEIVKSMEIDRCPVFKAGRGKEVGIKMKKVPLVGCRVYAVFTSS